jgi:hypothetical protein
MVFCRVVRMIERVARKVRLGRERTMAYASMATAIKNSTIAVYSTNVEALAATILLRKAAYDGEHVSVIGKGVKETRQVHGWIPHGSRAGSFGGWGELWGGLSGWLVLGFFWLPGIGWVAAAGWLAQTLVGSGISAGLGALTGLAVPVDEVPAYENELKADRYLVIVHGDSQSVERAHAILESAGPVRVNSYAA